MRPFSTSTCPAKHELVAEADAEEAQALLAGDPQAALEKPGRRAGRDPGNDDARYDYVPSC
jgi:hypothetical protein